ncbi:MAG: hypothetical protein EOP07_00730 [Proteobacteria bacterium]|nr:MAG: hypothetical protein EOP07_00730 [Pseudomonadota bacterium]
MFQPTADWRKSIWTKLIAASFIVMIVLGNIWLVMRFSTETPPLWLQTCFVISIGASFVFGAALGAERLLIKLLKADEDSNDDNA